MPRIQQRLLIDKATGDATLSTVVLPDDAGLTERVRDLKATIPAAMDPSDPETTRFAALRCDGCGTTVALDWDDPRKPDGWTERDDGDFCPACRRARRLTARGETDGMTACTASRFGDHDYSLPPHNTPDDPVDAADDGSCQVRSAFAHPACEHVRRYEVVLYQPGTHDWVRLYACAPCTAALRERHADLGPGGGCGVARVRDVPSASACSCGHAC